MDRETNRPPTPERVTRHEIEIAFRGLMSASHFAVLNVQPNASPEQVKAAYFFMAKRFHPDAVGRDPELNDLADKAGAIFSRLGTAYQALKHRPRPVQAPTAPAAAPTFASDVDTTCGYDPAAIRAQAEASLRQGVAYFGEGKFWDAIQLIEPILSSLEGGSLRLARLTLARAFAKNPQWVRRAEETLRDMIAAGPNDIEAHEHLGELYLNIRLKARGEAMLARAAELRARKDWSN
jgi:tetratricopeptide (TPR) repeat protein